MARGGTVAIAALVGVATVALVGYLLSRGATEGAAVRQVPVTTSGSIQRQADETPSPFATDPDAVSLDAAAVGTEPPDAGADLPEAARPSDDAATARQGPIDVASLGRADLDDDAFVALVAQLDQDPGLLAAVVDAFRAEVDPARLARLARLLGAVGGPTVTALAAELVYSTDPGLRAVGLDLLRRVQPGNGEARDIIAGLLSNGTDRETLMPVLQTLTRPGVVPVDERTRLAGQVSLLAGHDDPAVRRLGLSVLSRWSDGAENVTLMRDGLVDTHAGVREAAAYALVGRADPDGALTAELFAVADDADEDERVRRAAILALKNLPLDDADRARRLAIEGVLDLAPRR